MGDYYGQSYDGTGYEAAYSRGAGDQGGYGGSSGQWDSSEYSQGYDVGYDQGGYGGKSEGGYGGYGSARGGRGRGRGGYGGYQSGGGYQQSYSGRGGYRGRGGYNQGYGGYGGYSQGDSFRGRGRGRGGGGFQKSEFRTLEDTVYIQGLPETVCNEDLVNMFSICGEIKKNQTTGESCVFIFLDRATQKPTGAGSVAFVNKESATAAIEQFNNKDHNGQTLKVEYQKKRVKDYGGGGFRGGRGGGGGGGYGYNQGYGGYGGYNQGYGGGRGGYGGYGGYEGYN